MNYSAFVRHIKNDTEPVAATGISPKNAGSGKRLSSDWLPIHLFSFFVVFLTFKWFAGLKIWTRIHQQFSMDPVLILISDKFSVIRCHLMTDLEQISHNN